MDLILYPLMSMFAYHSATWIGRNNSTGQYGHHQSWSGGGSRKYQCRSLELGYWFFTLSPCVTCKCLLLSTYYCRVKSNLIGKDMAIFCSNTTQSLLTSRSSQLHCVLHLLIPQHNMPFWWSNNYMWTQKIEAKISCRIFLSSYVRYQKPVAEPP